MSPVPSAAASSSKTHLKSQSRVYVPLFRDFRVLLARPNRIKIATLLKYKLLWPAVVC